MSLVNFGAAGDLTGPVFQLLLHIEHTNDSQTHICILTRGHVFSSAVDS